MSELQKLRAEFEAVTKGIAALEAAVEELPDDAESPAVTQLHDQLVIKRAKKETLAATIERLQADDAGKVAAAEAGSRSALLALYADYQGRLHELDPALRRRVMKAVEEDNSRKLQAGSAGGAF